jgi:Protein of unknown function (DUF3987)
MNGNASRKCRSWIESFVDYTENLESATIFRKWAAITTVGAALEQKVFLETTAPLYPNLYTFLVGHPGVGKTRTINVASAFCRELTEFHVAPTSMTMASLVDCLVESKRTVIQMPNPAIEFNSMYILADELSAFMHKFEEEIIGGLTTFYDPNQPYSQHRRGKDIRIKIKRPQLSILSGTTPSNLMKLMPEMAWDQGFCSRIVMVYSDERPMADDMFNVDRVSMPQEMIHDLRVINSLVGQFAPDEDFRNAVNQWRKLGCPPAPQHPKLTHYNTRRRAHLLKLAMVACVDRSDSLILIKEDFNTALSWLLEAEIHMGEIFSAGAVTADGKAMDEIFHFVTVADIKGAGVPEPKVINFAKDRVPVHAVLKTIEVLIASGRIRVDSVNQKTGIRMFKTIQ